MKTILSCGLLVLCLTFAGCSVNSEQEGDSAEDTLWGPTRIVEDLRIGQYEGPSEYLFGSIAAIAQHPDGSIFIGDAQVPLIRRYDAEGNYMHDVGGEGQGPGEYQALQGMKLLPDGNLAIWDPQSRRVTVMTPDGDWVKDFPAGSGLRSGSPTFWVDFGGNFYVLTYQLAEGESAAFPPRLLLQYSPDGELIDSIEAPSRESDTSPMMVGTREGYLPNFTQYSVMTMSKAGHLVVGRTGSYAFDIGAGDTPVARVQHDWESVLIHPQEAAQWNARQEHIEKRIRERPASGFVNTPPPPEYVPVPETKPALMDIWDGEDGTIWVRRYAEARDTADQNQSQTEEERPPITWRQLPTFDVFSGDGEFLGTVELPNDVYVASFHTDYLWVIAGDEHDEDVAVRYHIEKGTDAGS